MKICFSYDCEGSWGWPEFDDGFFSEDQAAQISQAYGDLIDLHESFGIPATFAFVGAYALGAEERRLVLSDAVENGLLPPEFVDRAGAGWEGSANFDRAAAAKNVSIASHSMTHRTFDTLTVQDRLWELEQSKRALTQRAGVEVTQFVFPRNIVRLDPSPVSCFRSYRDTPRGSGAKRLFELGRGIVGFGPQSSPVSDFIYWKGGVRERFSDDGWKRLWANRLKKDSDLTIHVWAHPHNLVTDPTFAGRLEWLLGNIASSNREIQFVDLGGQTE